MEWWGGHYSEFMRMPATRRKRFMVWKAGREQERSDADGKDAARLASLMRGGGGRRG